jgi:hypothetical protein
VENLSAPIADVLCFYQRRVMGQRSKTGSALTIGIASALTWAISIRVRHQGVGGGVQFGIQPNEP